MISWRARWICRRVRYAFWFKIGRGIRSPVGIRFALFVAELLEYVVDRMDAAEADLLEAEHHLEVT